MRSRGNLLRWLVPLAVFCLTTAPALAQYPELECDPAGALPNGDQTGLYNYCTLVDTDADCDLEIADWDASFHSPDIRIGDPFNDMGPTPPEEPRFFLDTGDPLDTTDDRFYTKLYVRFRNAGGGLGGGGFAPADEVTVSFSYQETTDPAATDLSAGWIEAGTVVGDTYQMNIPTDPGMLPPGSYHRQQRAVCWSFPAGDLEPPKQFILRAEVHWEGTDGVQDNDDTNDVAYSYYNLAEAGRQAQIGFALDLSGSMNASFEGSDRLTVAKEKAALFASLVEDDNQLGVWGFHTGVSPADPFDTSYNDPPTPPQTFDDTEELSAMMTIDGDFDRGMIAGRIDSPLVTASGCTPVGQGLLRAREVINNTVAPSADAAKAIVVFSDGMENIRPLIDPVSGLCSATPVADPIELDETFADENFQIYSILFGPGAGWGFSVMNSLQSATGGEMLVYSAASDVELAGVYYAIRALVDDMIFFDGDGTATASAPWPAFEVEFDGATGLATAAVAWPVGNGETRLGLERRRKGDTPWLPCQESPAGTAEITGATSHFANAWQPDSFQVCRFAPGADSTWELRVVTEHLEGDSTPYTAAVFSEVRSAQIFPSLDDSGFSTGDALPIRAELRTDGRPLTGATVTAEVRVPSRSFSTTLFNYSSQLQPFTGQPGMQVSAMAAQLGQLLAQDTGADDIYVYRTVQVSLRDDGQGGDAVAGDGIYSGLLPGSETTIAGDYQVTITANAILPSGRIVQRTARLGAICNVGPADSDRSIMRVDLSPDPRGNLRMATVTVVPFDRFGNAAFPGSGGRVQLVGTGATATGNLVDNLDTSFSQTFTFTDDDARVEFVVDGQTVGSTPLIPVTKSREFSIHLGLAVPHGRFGTVTSSGPSVALDYALRLDQRFAVRFELALDRFDLVGGGDIDLRSLSVYAQYRWPGGTWEPYVETGLGLYDLENVSTAAGYSVGAGARRELSPRWDLDLNLQSHHVGGSLDLSFSRARVGAIKKF